MQAWPVSFLYVIELYAPNNRKDDSNEEEEKSRDKNAAVIPLFCLADLTRAVIGVELMSGSAHGDECEHDVSENEPDTDERTLSADEEHSRDECHQNARHKEGIRQDLEIDCRAIREKALGPDHEKTDQQFNAHADGIFD